MDLELVASAACKEGPALGYSSIEFASALPPTHQLSQDFRRASEQVVAFVKLHIYRSSHRLHLRRI